MGRKWPSSSKKIKADFVKAQVNFSITSIINEDLHINFGQSTSIFAKNIYMVRHEPQNFQIFLPVPITFCVLAMVHLYIIP